ncbi:MAG TPA: hypothetical protein PK468_23375 [Candidatus Hydrogenedentes bacterium]|nr:hypothetical protein [Candidatus Hydrogenedentota bacterium]
MDKKSLQRFLGMSFALSYLSVGAITLFHLASFEPGHLAGIVVVYGVLWLPALVAGVVSRKGGAPALPRPALWPKKRKSVLAVTLGVAAVFLSLYTVTTVAGRTRADWDLVNLTAQLGLKSGGLQATFLLAAGFAFTLLLGPTLYAVFCLGNELAWRGVLFQSLLPKGRLRAHLLTGIAWGLYLLPLTVATFGLNWGLWKPMVALLTMSLALSIVLGELYRRSGQIGLSVVCLACFESQRAGMWFYLFPDRNSVWAGTFGLVSLALWTILAAILVALPDRQAKRADDPSSEPATES